MYNSDGYVMIDMSDVDLTKSSQNIPGIYKRVLEVIDTNKLALIVNAGNNTPMAAVVHKKLNYYKITTLLYIFTINTNDIVIVEESGEATVDVEIVPTLTEGTKIADFSIGAVEGELFAPSQQSEINDNVTAVNSTWSSSKISTELSAKADTGDLATVATSGSYTDLSNKPTIPVLTDLIDDTTESTTKVWSSDKTAYEIAAGAGVTIDDTTTSLTKTWSSDKINSELSDKADTSTTYTKTEVDTALSSKANSSDVYTKSEVDTALASKADYSVVTTPTLNNQFIDTSDSWFYVKKIGKFCYINGRLKLTSAVANNYGLVFNMPLAAGNSLMMVFVSGRDFNNKANTFIVSCVVSNGTLTIQTYPDSIESGKYLYINAFYECQ